MSKLLLFLILIGVIVNFVNIKQLQFDSIHVRKEVGVLNEQVKLLTKVNENVNLISLKLTAMEDICNQSILR